VTYDVNWDRPHPPGPQELWQESDAYWFYDAEAGVGGFHRVGQKPNLGLVTVFAFARDGERVTLNDSYTRPRVIGSADRWATGHRVDGHVAESLGSQKMRFSLGGAG
jgi:hypothetical protein